MPLGPGDAVVCSGSMGRAPLDLAVPAAAAAGFRGLSTYHDDHVALLDRGWSGDDVQRWLRRHDLSIAELDGVCRWLPGDTVGPMVDDFLAVAAELDARSVTLLEIDRRTIGVDLTIEQLALRFGEVCDRAAALDLLVHLEYFPYSAIDRFEVAWEIARRAERSNGGILLDTWHHWRGPDRGRLDLPDAAIPQVLAIQLGDVEAVPWVDRRHEMMHGRLVPGTGVADLTGLLARLRDGGCTAPLEVEVYSDGLSAVGAGPAAELCAAALRSLVG